MRSVMDQPVCKSMAGILAEKVISPHQFYKNAWNFSQFRSEDATGIILCVLAAEGRSA